VRYERNLKLDGAVTSFNYRLVLWTMVVMMMIIVAVSNPQNLLSHLHKKLDGGNKRGPFNSSACILTTRIE